MSSDVSRKMLDQCSNTLVSIWMTCDIALPMLPQKCTQSSSTYHLRGPCLGCVTDQLRFIMGVFRAVLVPEVWDPMRSMASVTSASGTGSVVFSSQLPIPRLIIL